ncbi:hypothetical protein KKF34_17050 [Myxococcota bacterium]|nr:hypothetical protein [Myxococcota bacterium]MBU1381811.1 hypothetical protein [Myxococcota bacterium]MBU1498588.1 hypothetical protein [Myxococcota bacterium]
MPHVSTLTKTLQIKIVFYGPGLSGKTTNLEKLSVMLSRDRAGELMSLDTKGDRTLFFDWMPLDLGKIRGFDVRIQLYTVPGQVRYNKTRQQVLRGADGVVFVADSQKAAAEQNTYSFSNLRENMSELGVDIEELPMVIQCNKKDLPETMTTREMAMLLRAEHLPFIEAVASQGKGVMETLRLITRLTMKNIQKYLSPSRLINVDEMKQDALDGDSLLEKIMSNSEVSREMADAAAEDEKKENPEVDEEEMDVQYENSDELTPVGTVADIESATAEPSQEIEIEAIPSDEDEPPTSGTDHPDTEGSNRPDTEGSNRPYTEGSNHPDTEGSNHPDTEGSNHPDTEGSNLPDTEATAVFKLPSLMAAESIIKAASATSDVAGNVTVSGEMNVKDAPIAAPLELDNKENSESVVEEMSSSVESVQRHENIRHHDSIPKHELNNQPDENSKETTSVQLFNQFKSEVPSVDKSLSEISPPQGASPSFEKKSQDKVAVSNDDRELVRSLIKRIEALEQENLQLREDILSEVSSRLETIEQLNRQYREETASKTISLIENSEKTISDEITKIRNKTNELSNSMAKVGRLMIELGDHLIGN